MIRGTWEPRAVPKTNPEDYVRSGSERCHLPADGTVAGCHHRTSDHNTTAPGSSMTLRRPVRTNNAQAAAIDLVPAQRSLPFGPLGGRPHGHQ